jgi:hypothetical protein
MLRSIRDPRLLGRINQPGCSDLANVQPIILCKVPGCLLGILDCQKSMFILWQSNIWHPIQGTPKVKIPFLQKSNPFQPLDGLAMFVFS